MHSGIPSCGATSNSDAHRGMRRHRVLDVECMHNKAEQQCVGAHHDVTLALVRPSGIIAAARAAVLRDLRTQDADDRRCRAGVPPCALAPSVSSWDVSGAVVVVAGVVAESRQTARSTLILAGG